MTKATQDYDHKTVRDYWIARYRSLTNRRHLPRDCSPLRYPGGKGSLKYFLANTLFENRFEGATLIEPFCGGAGASLPLLIAGHIRSLHLNDSNPAVAAFWHSVFFDTYALASLVKYTPVTMRQWHRCREVIDHHREASTLELGFAAFFMNRCNRSGLLTSGPIGGYQQTGKYKLDCRYNKENLISRILSLGTLARKVTVSCDDACSFLSNFDDNILNQSLIFLDPPYVKQGHNLYKKYSFEPADHERLANFIKPKPWHWLITYDDHPLIHRLYAERARDVVELSYQMQQAKFGRELFVASAHCRISLPNSHEPETRKEYPNEPCVAATC